MKSIIGIVLCGLLLVAVNAQGDAPGAIQKISAAYNTRHAISFNGDMKMYAKNNPTKIIERMTSSYIIRGTNFVCRMGPVEMLLNDNYYVSADRAIKLIMIGYRKDLQGTGQMPVLNTGQFKKWIETNTIEATVIAQGAASVLQLTDKHGVTGYNIYNIEYENVTGYMKKVLLEMWDSNDASHKTIVLEINYTAPVAAETNAGAFSEKRFFSVSNHKIQVNENFKGYQLMNQL